MRFFLRHSEFKNDFFDYAPNRPFEGNDDGSCTDSSYERRNATYSLDDGVDDAESIKKRRFEFWEHECAGNEHTPIQKLPSKLLEHIFELGMEDFKPVHYSEDDSDSESSVSNRVKDLKAVVGRDRLKWSDFGGEEEDRKRSDFLHDVGRVCSGWWSVAGPMDSRVIMVDGFPSDFDRAIKMLKVGFPGLSSDDARGSVVRDLIIDIQADFVFEEPDFEKKVVELLRICSNVQNLTLRSIGVFKASETQDIWKDGIARLAPSLVSLEWSSSSMDAENSVGFVQYLGQMEFLTELYLEDNDKEYEFDGWASISLPRVHTYRLKAKNTSIMRYQSKWDMRALKHLDLYVGRYEESEEDYDREGVYLFFKAHGGGLTYLEIKKLPSLPNTIQSILDAAPLLDQLAIDIGLMNFKDEWIRHNGVKFLFVSGFYVPATYRNASLGTYFASFAKSLREEKTFPNMDIIKIQYSTATQLGMGLSVEAISEWEKWFDSEQSRRPVILDGQNRKA